MLGLNEIGAIAGKPTDEGLADWRVTERGAKIINPPADDPMARARAKLNQRSKADAMTAAVEEGLGARLKSLAASAGIDLRGPKGRPLDLGQINDRLKAEGVYGSPDHKETWAEIAWILQLRNAADHGRGGTLTSERPRRAIDAADELATEALPSG